MSRNGSGTYTTPNTMVSGATITASDHNENYSDIGAELTNSVAADGQTSMTGALKGFAGTVDAPGIAFGSDPDTGMYRIGANNLGLSAGGTNIVNVSTTGITITGTLSVSGAQTWTGQATLAAGALNFDGTVSLPAYSFTNDTDSGLYRIGDNNIGVAVNGAKVLDIGTGLSVTGTLTASSTVTASNGLTVSAGSVSLPTGSVAGAAINSDLFASLANMEAASSNAVAATPGRLHYHPAMPKVVGNLVVASGSVSLSSGSFGITSVSRAAAGSYIVNFSTNLSDTSYSVICTAYRLNSTIGSVVTSKSVGGCAVATFNTADGSLIEVAGVEISVIVYGDQ